MSKSLFAIMLVGTIVLLHYCKSHFNDVTTLSMAQPLTYSNQAPREWDGIYRGILPCADCQGMQVTIYLNKNRNYKQIIKYLGKSDSALVYTGVISWNTKGNTVTLHNAPKPNNYFVGEGTLTQLDMNGNKITGNLAQQYILSKNHFAILEKYWKLVELNGKPVNLDSTTHTEPHLILKEAANEYTGNSSCNNFYGTYVLEGANKISFGNAKATRMACPRMDIESLFLNALTSADNYYVKGDELVLNKAKMAPLARFKTKVMK